MTLDLSNSLKLKNSVYNSDTGRYVLGGDTEVSASKLEWWSKRTMPTDPTDIVYFFEKKYEGRPEILGHVFYGDINLWWVIAQYNSILDPLTDLVEGSLLLIPLLDRVKRDLFTSVTLGGIPSTR